MSGESKWVKFVQQVSILQQSSAGSSITHCSLSLHILLSVILPFSPFSSQTMWIRQPPPQAMDDQDLFLRKFTYFTGCSKKWEIFYQLVVVSTVYLTGGAASELVTPNDWIYQSQRLALWLTANWTLLKMWWWGDHWTICYPLWKILATRSTTY